MERGLTRRDFLARSGALAGAAVLAPLALVRVPDAAAAGTFLDEARFSFDPHQLLEPDRAVWSTVRGALRPRRRHRGLGAQRRRGDARLRRGRSTSLPAGLGVGHYRADRHARRSPDESGAWVDDAISPRLVLADGTVRAELAWARDPEQR